MEIYKKYQAKKPKIDGKKIGMTVDINNNNKHKH